MELCVYIYACACVYAICASVCKCVFVHMCLSRYECICVGICVYVTERLSLSLPLLCVCVSFKHAVTSGIHEKTAVPRNCGMWRWIPEWLEYWRPNGEVWRSIPLWCNELTSVDTTVENEYLLP